MNNKTIKKRFYRETLNHLLLDILQWRVVWLWLRLSNQFITLRELVLTLSRQYNLLFYLLQVYPWEFFGSLREC
jgi:hypothetical protein